MKRLFYIFYYGKLLRNINLIN